MCIIKNGGDTKDTNLINLPYKEGRILIYQNKIKSITEKNTLIFAIPGEIVEFITVPKSEMDSFFAQIITYSNDECAVKSRGGSLLEVIQVGDYKVSYSPNVEDLGLSTPITNIYNALYPEGANYIQAEFTGTDSQDMDSIAVYYKGDIHFPVLDSHDGDYNAETLLDHIFYMEYKGIGRPNKVKTSFYEGQVVAYNYKPDYNYAVINNKDLTEHEYIFNNS